MRSLPCKVIALLGMNDGLFPRADHSVGFDLMRFQRNPGDNRPRDEDRHLFLEAVLSAGDRLIITCQGQDVRDQRPCPPSVPVQELLDVLSQTDDVELAENLEDDAAGGLRETLFIRHPLQAFGPQYFDGQCDVPTSFDSAALKAAKRLQGQPESAAVFAAKPLSLLSASDVDSREAFAELNSVDVGDLRVLHERPWVLFLRRIGIGDLSVSDDAGDREPLVLDGLQYWQAGDDWLNRSLAGELHQDICRQLIRTGCIPAGSRGESVVRELKRDTGRIISAMEKGNLQTVTESLPVNLHIAGVVLAGEVSGWTGRTIHRGTFSKVSVKYAARLWIDHLIATVICDRILEPAVLVGRDGTKATISEIKPDEAFAHLEKLIDLSQIARSFPLPFFVSKEVVKPVWKSEVDFEDRQSTSAYIFAARNSFVQAPFVRDSSGRRRPAPADEPDIRVAFAGVQPFELRCAGVPALQEEGDRNLFAYLAEQFCVPFAGHLESFPG